MKRLLRFGWITMICIWAVVLVLQTGASSAAIDVVETKAHGAALIDVQSGRILYSKAGDKPMRIASLTKVMTAIVAIESGKLTDEVKVSGRAAGKEGSSIYLKSGETMSLHHMLYGMMLRSGNDAATAIAEHVGGSVEGFVFQMNQKAALLGMEHTTFSNPTGLDEGGGNTASANDMAKLTAYALRNPVFQEIVKTKVKRVPNPEEAWDYVWSNKNRMLSLYDGADGVKTGYTKLANRCLITSATRSGQQLAVVTLDDGDDWIDHKKLLDYGFQHYSQRVLVEQGEQVGAGGWLAGRAFMYPLSDEEANLVRNELFEIGSGTTDYKLGLRGELRYSLDGRQIGSVPLYDKDSNRPELRRQAPGAKGQSLNAFRAQSWLDALQAAFTSLFLTTEQDLREAFKPW